MSLYPTQVLRTRTTRGRVLFDGLYDLWSRFEETIAAVPWPFGANLAKATILKALAEISQGQVTIITANDIHIFGNTTSNSSAHATLTVKDEAFWRRVALFSDLGLAEAFMIGEVDCDNMSAFLQIVIKNRDKINTHLEGVSTSFLALGRRLTAYKFLGDSFTSPANISAHYDLGNKMFNAFLSEDMNYSSAIFLDYNEDLVHGITIREPLESAQERKIRNIIIKAQIRPGDRILEIGTGWGALAITIAHTVSDCTIDTVTLSGEQRDLAVERIAKAGLSDRIRVHHMDFRQCRDMPGWGGAFDRFVSIEMIENVGKDFIEEYWSIVDWILKGQSAIGVAQVITMPEARIPAYDASGADFVQKWIFPGCYIPSLRFLVDTMCTGSLGRLTIDSVSNIGPHYARTLREWKRKFLANWNATIMPALQAQYGLDQDALGVFKRKWIYYFDYCEAGFATRTLGDHIITFTREGNIDFGCDSPLVMVPGPVEFDRL